MKKSEMKSVENYFEAFLILFLVGFFLFIIKDYLISLLMASVFVFLTYNSYKKLSKRINKNLSAIYIIFLVFIIILLPSILIISSLITQTNSIIQSTDSIIEEIDLSGCSLSICDNLNNNLNYLDSIYESASSIIEQYLLKSLVPIFDSLSAMIINLFIFVLAYFYFLKDGDKFLVYIKRIIPMKNEYKEALFIKFRDVNRAVFINSILVAMIQGGLLGVGFFIFGVSSPLLWGVIGAFFALIPMIGTLIVWLPVLIYFILVGAYLKALLFFLFCGIIVGLSDNILRPYLIKKKIEVHPFLILLSILGGLGVFNFMGIFIGPLIISLLISILQLYKLDFK